MNKVVVIIPLYKPELNVFDRISVGRTCAMLSSYPLVVIHPEGMDTNKIAQEFPALSFRAFAPEYFKGIMGYNRLMLSSDLYGSFLDYEYMLVCQSDAYIIRDELASWCDKGYDYIGAPWLRRPMYNMPIMKQCMQISLWWKHLRGRRSKMELYNKVGNGGLSLRKVKSFYDVTLSEQELICTYTNREKKAHLYNEDVFWAIEPKSFTYPSVNEALLFAFDKYPALCYRQTGGQMPFGCHAWYKRKMRKFWEQTLPTSFRIE